MRIVMAKLPVITVECLNLIFDSFLNEKVPHPAL